MTQEFGVATFGSAVGDSFIMPLSDREPVRRSDVLIIIICTLYQYKSVVLNTADTDYFSGTLRTFSLYLDDKPAKIKKMNLNLKF